MRLRHAMSAIGWLLLLGLVSACTSTVSGTASYGGPPPTTEESSADSSEEASSDESTDSSPTEDGPGLDETLICLTVQIAYTTANQNFVAFADATNNGTPTTLTAETVAADFDAAITDVAGDLATVPPGEVFDAVTAAQTAATALRDGLRAAAPGASNADLIAALDAADTACGI